MLQKYFLHKERSISLDSMHSQRNGDVPAIPCRALIAEILCVLPRLRLEQCAHIAGTLTLLEALLVGHRVLILNLSRVHLLCCFLGDDALCVASTASLDRTGQVHASVQQFQRKLDRRIEAIRNNETPGWRRRKRASCIHVPEDSSFTGVVVFWYGCLQTRLGSTIDFNPAMTAIQLC